MPNQTSFIIDSDFVSNNKDSFYNNFYEDVTKDLMAWRDFGAIEKYHSIEKLCNGLIHNRVVEFGCGLCSIIKLLDKNDFASEIYGLEVSPSAVKFIERNISIPHLRAICLTDTTHTSFKDKFFDIGILSHVVEHVPKPELLIKEALRVCNYVVIEVPLEVNLSTFFYNKLARHDPLDNLEGHIQFFTKHSFRDVVNQSGGIILKDRLYRGRKCVSRENLSGFVRSSFFYALFKLTHSFVVGSEYAVLAKSKS